MKHLIIDGNNLVHRTYWTAKTQSNRVGEETQEQLNNFHIYFTLNAIYSYANKYNPDRTIVVWDGKIDYQQNARKTEFADYKGNRSSDSSPHQNNKVIQEMLECLGIKSVFPRELEADDIVAYLCKNLSGAKIIVSVDKDFLQLIRPEVILFDPIRKKEYGCHNFVEQTGWDISEWLPAKCIKGDKSDNVPGIAKFGDARIKKWLEGKIELTEEQQSIYDRNFKLFSLDNIDSYKDEQQYYQSQLDVSCSVDWNKFLDECKKRDFNSILKKKQDYYSLFLLKDKLKMFFE
jgi:5'-3' exonuclease